MTTTRRFLHALLAAALLAALPAEAAVSGVMTYSGILKSAAGVPVTTSTNITFRLYTASSGGSAIWSDTVSVTPGADGWFSAPLGILSPLVPSAMGQDLYLSLQVGTDSEFTQRARVTPSGSALAVDWSGVQGKPSCASGQYLTLDAGTGNLLCTTPAGGTVGFTPPSCATGQVMKWSGTAWTCAADANTGITLVVTGTPLSGTGVSGSAVTLAPCANGQILQSNGTTWSCIATPTGGTGGVTSVAVTAPVTNSGTAAAPNIGVGLASGISNGIITAADFIAFNAKAPTNNPTFTGTVTAPTFVGNLTGNAATATTAATAATATSATSATTATTATTALSANAVAANVITPSDLNTGTAPVAGQVPSRGLTDSFAWITPQLRVTGICGTGQVMKGVNADGSVACGYIPVHASGIFNLSTAITNTCMNAGSVTINAPAAGQIEIVAAGWLSVSHTLNNYDVVYSSIGVSATDCGGAFDPGSASYAIAPSTPTLSGNFVTVNPVQSVTVTAAGTYTYYFNHYQYFSSVGPALIYRSRINATWHPAN